MANTERLYRLTVDASQAVRELQKLNTSVGGIDKKFSVLGAGFKAFAVSAAAAFGGGQLVSGMKKAVDSMDEMGKAAQKVGVSLSVMQDLKHMADLSGVSFETLQTSVGRLAQAMSGFEGVGKKAADALAALGVNVKGGTSEALSKIADQFQKMPDGAQKTALAMEIFGKAGKDMVPFLNQGGDAVKKMADEADRLGLKFSEVASEQAERFNDALSKIAAIGQGITRQFMTGLLPALTALAESFVDNYKKGTLFESIGKGIGAAMIFVSKYVIVASEYIKAFGNALGDVIAASIEAAKGNFGLAATILSMGDKVSDVEQRIAARIAGIETNYERNRTQTEATTKRIGRVNVQLDRNAEKAKAAADETKRFNDEINKVAFELAAANYAIGNEGKEWDDIQKWAQQGNYSIRQMFSPEREREIEAVVERLQKARIALDAMRAAEAQASADDAKVAGARRQAAETEAERLRNQDAIAKSLKEQAQAFIEAADPIAKYETEMKKLESLKPYLPLQLYAKLVKELGENAQTWFEPIKREIGFLESAGQIMNDNFQSFFDNMQRGVAGAKEAFERMAQSMLIQLARLAASKAFDKFFGEGTSWGLANPFTPKASGRSLTHSPDAIPSIRRAGGPADAPSYSVSQSSPVSVNVINNAGSEVSVEQRQNNDGSLNIDIMVERKVRGMIANGSMDRVMASTFGARRRGFA